MIMLFDADSAIISSCYRQKLHEDDDGFMEDIDEALAKFDERFQSVVNHLSDSYGIEVDQSIVFVQGKNNFRYFIDPNYKHNRKKWVKPPLVEPLKALVTEKYNAFVCNGVETDDTIASYWAAYTKIFGDDSCFIATIDKDYKQFPCWYFDCYYNFDETKSRFGEFYKISDSESLSFFWSQMVSGDSGDGVSGLKGYGQKKSDALFFNKGKPKPMSGFQCLSACYRLYLKQYKTPVKARVVFWKNYLLLRLRTDVKYLPEIEF